jgi:hypothetical protein
MLLRTVHKVALGLGLVGVMLSATAPMSQAGDCCGPCWHCPPPYIHCQYGPPRLKFKCVCPLPVCGPCDLKHFGYFPTCWAPYPFPQDYSCCPPPPFGPGIPAVAPVPVGKLPDSDYTQAPRTQGATQMTQAVTQMTPIATQMPATVPAAAAMVTPNQVARPSPYNPAVEYAPGR